MIKTFRDKKWKKTLAVALAALLFCVLLLTGGEVAAATYFGNSNRKVPIYRVRTQEKKIAISFDAAWGADKTQAILDCLKRYGVSATFFLVGFWTEKFPEMVKAIDAAGCEIGTHSNTHGHMSKMNEKTVLEELNASKSLISAITGKSVDLFRAPFGEFDNQLLECAKKSGLFTIQWDVDSLDWKGLSGGEIATRVLNRAKEGSIVLFHNNSDHIEDALHLILPRLIARGFEIVPIGELIYRDGFGIDHAGEQFLLPSEKQSAESAKEFAGE